MDAVERHMAAAVQEEGNANLPMEKRKKQSSQTMEAVKDVIFGSTAGIAGKVIEYPFDTVKVRLQSQPDHLPLRYRGPIDCFRKSFREDGGLRSLYRGISAPLLGAALETSSLFFSVRLALLTSSIWPAANVGESQQYNLAQAALISTLHPAKDPLSSQQSLGIPALVACGAASGAFTSLLLTPIELIKCKMQVPVLSSPSQSPVSLIASIYRHHGLLGFWHGQFATFLRETGGSAAWFGSYEGVSAVFRLYLPRKGTRSGPGTERCTGKSTLPLHQQMIAGACAGVCYNFIFYPADTIKSRMQTEEVVALTKGRPKTSFLSVGRAMWRTQGLQGLYRGCGITVFRAAPSSAFIFSVYEGLKQWVG